MNALVIIGFVIFATIIVLLCFKYRCTRVRYSYWLLKFVSKIFSSSFVSASGCLLDLCYVESFGVHWRFSCIHIDWHSQNKSGLADIFPNHDKLCCSWSCFNIFPACLHSLPPPLFPLYFSYSKKIFVLNNDNI